MAPRRDADADVLAVTGHGIPGHLDREQGSGAGHLLGQLRDAFGIRIGDARRCLSGLVRVWAQIPSGTPAPLADGPIRVGLTVVCCPVGRR